MKKIFPPMNNCLGTGHVFCIFVYWIFAFVLFPFLMPVIGYGLWDDLRVMSWVECGYYLINGFVLTRVMKEHLADALFELKIDPKSVWGTVGITCALMLIWMSLVRRIWSVLCLFIVGTPLPLDVFPMSEMAVALTGGLLVEYNPIFGMICLTLVTPFSICGFFYATGFSKVCYQNPKLAYWSLILVLLLPALFEVFWRGDAFYVFLYFVLRLPIHLFACWSYQKTDNIWTPIFSLGIFNLLTSVMVLVMY